VALQKTESEEVKMGETLKKVTGEANKLPGYLGWSSVSSAHVQFVFTDRLSARNGETHYIKQGFRVNMPEFHAVTVWLL
jgi:hypothetical protein